MAGIDLRSSTPQSGASMPISNVGVQAVPASALSTFKAAHLAAVAGTGLCKVLTLTDSIGEGTGQTDPLGAWPARLLSKWRASYRPAEPTPLGWRPITSGSTTLVLPWSLTGTTAQSVVGGLRGGPELTLSGAGGGFTGTVTGTAIDIWYTTSSTSTSFNVSIDGGTATVVGGSSTIQTSGVKTRISLGASGAHTVTVTRGSGNAFIEGVHVFDGNETVGYQIFNAGRHGARAIDISNLNSAGGSGLDYYQRQAISVVAPDLAIIGYGLNDQAFFIGAGAYATALETIGNNARTRFDTSLIVLIPHQRTTDADFPSYQKAAIRAAGRLGAAYLDMSTIMPVVGSTAGNSSGYYADTTGHLTATGADVYAQAVKDWLVTALAATT